MTEDSGRCADGELSEKEQAPPARAGPLGRKGARTQTGSGSDGGEKELQVNDALIITDDIENLPSHRPS